MLGIFPFKNEGKIATNPHFWAIIAITLALILIYQAWPWRESNIEPWFLWLAPLYNLAVMEFVNHIIGILFLIPIIYAAVFFSWKGALVACLLSLGGVLPIIADMWPNYYLVTNITLLLLPLLIVSLATIELEWRRKERKIFAEREEERQVYISKVLESQENERLRIAQELHDDTIQTLLVIANRAETLVPAGDDMKEVRKNAEWIRDTTLETVEGLRRISLDLRPSILGDLGLVPALRWLVDRMNKESGINTRIMVNGKKRKLSPEAEITIFRITQEALNNVKRHSRATEAVVTLEFTPEGCLRISIEDNGQGFRPPKKFDRLASSGKLGLIGMHQRIDFLGGTFAIRSKPGEGTLLLIEARC